ncbi:hypothetical protein U9M48_005196 [Paspalum notatum var. saurae]|uniref:Uncharacterized protein n=1 Tax=Paspalum notatum var. saurae TaxID=547442 RepID=A0AAQ3SLA9_PASNO
MSLWEPRLHYLPWLCAAVAQPRDAPRPRIHALLARRDRIRGERPAAPSCPAPTRRRLAEAGSARPVEAGSATAELPPGWVHPHRASSQPVTAAWPGHAAAVLVSLDAAALPQPSSAACCCEVPKKSPLEMVAEKRFYGSVPAISC